MTLLNGALALGVLAFTIPLAIHLLFRNRFRTIDWGAMHLLDSVVRINRRRIQLMNLLLLLLRCLLPVLLALCLARPVLTGFRALAGDVPRTLVIAIDDSRSMAARDQTGLSRIEQAKRAVTEILAKLSRRDEVILIRASTIGAPPGTMGSQDAIQRVREISAAGGPVDLSRLVRAAVEAADIASYQHRSVLIVSDFQSNVVGDGAVSSLDRLQASLREMTVQPTISFLNLGVESNQLDNVSVDSIKIDSPALVAGRGGTLSARLRNGGDSSVHDLRLIWSVDGTPLDSRTVTLEPRSSLTSRLTHTFDRVGVFDVSVAIEHGDAILEDNTRSIGIDVIREIEVLIVDGKPSVRPLEGESDFLAIALSPFAMGGQDQPDAIRATVLRAADLGQRLDQLSADIVVLANVDRVSEIAKKWVAQFVNDGGALIVFDGEAVKTDFYNQPWNYDGGSWSLPAHMGEFVGNVRGRDAGPLPIGEINSQYTPWSTLADQDTQPLDGVDVFGYRKLVIREPGKVGSEGVRSPAPMELLNMASGDPLVVSAQQGKGRVVQFAIPCDADWTTLPIRLVYLPMMQQLVLDLAGSRKQTTVDIGSGLSIPTAELFALLPQQMQIDDRKPITYSIESPDGTEIAINPSNEPSPQLFLDSTSTAGIYRVRMTAPVADGEAFTTSTLRVVEVPAIESRLLDADPVRLAAAAESIEANIYTEIESLQSDDRTRRFGREIWRWLLWLLLIGMVGELFLQQRSQRRTLAPSATVRTSAVGASP